MTTGECKSTLNGHTGDVNSVTISPDGKLIVGSDRTIWEGETGQVVGRLPGAPAGRRPDLRQ